MTHLPRWAELPDLELYLDQVLGLLEKHLAPFFPCAGGPVMTASMVNNYVKQRLLPAPVKKRYTRRHVSLLLMIGILKPAFALPQIKALLVAAQQDDAGAAAFYDHFCDLLEGACAACGEKAAALSPQHPAVELAVLTVAYQAATQAALPEEAAPCGGGG